MRLSFLVISGSEKKEPGIIQGPYLYTDWLEYSYQLLDLFHDVQQGNKEPDWNDIFFRSTDHYYSGSYNDFSPIALILCEKIISEQVRQNSYAAVHSGIELHRNIFPIEVKNGRKFSNNL